MSFIAELKRRNVIRTAAAYLAFAWLGIEVSQTLLPLFGLGPNAVRLVVILFALGFVPVLVASWMFEFTLAGVRPDREVDHEAPDRKARSRRLDRWVVVFLAFVLCYFIFDKFVLAPVRESATVEEARQEGAAEALVQAQSQAFDQSVAVLPFTNASGDPANDYLSEGIADELRDHIALQPELRVVARRSSARFRDSTEEFADIGRQLGVSRILEGRLDRKGDRLLVSVELVDAVSGFRLWSRSYDRPGQDLMLVQQALANDVLGQLMPRLAGQAQQPPPSLQQVAAHDLLLLGRQYEQQVLEEQRVDSAMLEKVIGLYEQAAEIDPLSAEAQARLGRMLLYAGEVQRAEPAILKAVELDPDRGETFAALGLYFWLTRQEGIGAAYRRALELNPNDADTLSYYASWSWMQGSADAAVDYYRKALEIDPMSLVRYADLGYKLAFGGSREQAQAVLGQVLERFPNAPGFLVAARITEALGDLDEAIAWALKAHQLRPGDEEAAGHLGELLARIGEAGAAARFAEEAGMGLLYWQRRYADMIDLGEELRFDQPDDVDLLFMLAFAYSALGDDAEAVELIEQAGMPGTVLSESRRASEMHATSTLAGALQAVGRNDEALELARFYAELNQQLLATEGPSAWAPRLGRACMSGVLGDDEAALAMLETLPALGTLAWLPTLRDQVCFRRFRQEPRYQAVVAALEKRAAALRERLPATLARHGLALPSD
jgi:TolB-like protein/Tfp pilus assembly protein PilF